MTIAGLILSNLNRGKLPEMTRRRILSSVPFGCRYRLIDFPLSNMVNAGITNIGIATDFNYKSLLDHIGTGKDWDLARRSGGVRMLPPLISGYDPLTNHQTAFPTRLSAMMSTLDFVRHCTEDIIVLCDGNVVCNMDLRSLVEEHLENDADITFVAQKMNVTEGMLDRDDVLVECDEDGRLTSYARALPRDLGERSVMVNVMVMKTAFMRNMLENAAAHGASSFDIDVLRPNINRWKLHVSYFEGFCAQINSMENYFQNSMKLLEGEVRADLFQQEGFPILTKVRNSAPTKYAPGSKVTGSLIADGCVIEGTVENSILFRGVHVGRGTVIRNSILLQNTYTGNNVTLQGVITDKNVTIRDDRMLAGHATMPFYIEKGARV
jgi:glucose-1-phosphate adenylyltransferase